MWCEVLWVVGSWWVVAGSVVEINDETFATLPPLYGLDDWARCQRDGDVYCIVDAALIAAQPSATLSLLQDYSKQSLKHYNRTEIHRGMCVSRCGGTNDTGSWRHAAQTCLNDGLSQYGLEAEILSVDYCVTAGASPRSPGAARALVVVVTILIALTCLATGVHVLGDRCGNDECNRFLLSFSLKQNMEILTYNRLRPRSDSRMRDVASIEGMRFLAMQCVIFSHVMLIYVYSFVDNPQYVERMYDHFGWQAVFNSPLWLQAFFAMSGFLTAYGTLLSTKPVTLCKCLLSIVYRWVRLTPLALFALWFTIAWFPLLGTGPQWTWLVTREADDCSERWWYHILYVHNYLPTGKFCMGHTWYLAADMQLHTLGVFILLLLMRWRTAVVPVLMLLTVLSSMASGLVVYFHQLAPIITAQSPEILRNLFAGSKILTQVYVPFWMNLPGYIGGMATAFVLHHNSEANLKLKDNKWFNGLFHSALLLGSAVVVAGAIFLSDTAPPLWAGAVYSALDRSLVAMFFCVFMLGCFSRCRSLMRDALEWRGFHILGRLSYCVFLTHFIVLRLTLAGNTQLGHATLVSMLSLLVTSSVMSYVIAIPLCLLVELPLIQLWKVTVEGDSGSYGRKPKPDLERRQEA